MRYITSIFITAIMSITFFTSCEKDDPVNPGDNPSFIGDFVSGVHATSGMASIDKDKTTLSLTDFKTDSGPDLNIYLARNIASVTSDYIDLGNIKGIDGDYTYALSGNTDYTKYKYVVVWCVAFDVNFGWAELVKQ